MSFIRCDLGNFLRFGVSKSHRFRKIITNEARRRHAYKARGFLLRTCACHWLDSHLNPYVNYRISSSRNNSRGRLFLFSHKKGEIIRGKAIIRGGLLFQILLTGSHALSIRFHLLLFH